MLATAATVGQSWAAAITADSAERMADEQPHVTAGSRS